MEKSIKHLRDRYNGLVKAKNYVDAEKVQTMLKAKEKEFEISRGGVKEKKREERQAKAKTQMDKLQQKHEKETHDFEKKEAFVLKSFHDDHEKEKKVVLKKHANTQKIQDLLTDREQQILTRDSCLAQNNYAFAEIAKEEMVKIDDKIHGIKTLEVKQA